MTHHYQNPETQNKEKTLKFVKEKYQLTKANPSE